MLHCVSDPFEGKIGVAPGSGCVCEAGEDEDGDDDAHGGLPKLNSLQRRATGVPSQASCPISSGASGTPDERYGQPRAL